MNSMRMSLSIHKLTLTNRKWQKDVCTCIHLIPWESLSEKISFQLSLELPWQSGHAPQSGEQRVPDSGHDEAESELSSRFEIAPWDLQQFLVGRTEGA